MPAPNAPPATRHTRRHRHTTHGHACALLGAALTATLVASVAGDILIYTRTTLQLLVEEFPDQPAHFGPHFAVDGLQSVATVGVPLANELADGCGRMKPPPPAPPSMNGTALAFAVIVARGGCEFIDKVRNAQRSGFDAVIVHNVESNNLEIMSAKDDDGINIPSMFVGELTGRLLLANYQFNHDYILVLNADLPFDINTHLILPFSVVVGLCFVIMMGFMIMKCVREQRRQRRHRLPISALKAIPVVRFNKSTMTYETCAICLDDYTDGEKLRVLPCDHAYHCKCIDVWLTRTRRVCPICKRKVLLRPRQNRRLQAANATAVTAAVVAAARHRHQSSEDSTSDSDADDATPLLNPVDNSAANSQNHGTFGGGGGSGAGAGQRVNPFDRSPNLPPNLMAADEPRSVYERFLSIFDRTPPPPAVAAVRHAVAAAVAELDAAAAASAVIVSIPSNNIRNANLSGSFHDYTTTTTMSTTPPPQSDLDDPSNPALRTHSIYEPQPSSSQQARLGVVAIPNLEFSPSPPESHRSAGVAAKPPNDFIV